MSNQPPSAQLLDMLAAQMGCHYVSDLKYLPHNQRTELSRVVAELPSDFVPLYQWNDALKYLFHSAPEASPDFAREKLAALLTGSHMDR